MTGILGVVRVVATCRGSSTVCPIHEVAANAAKYALPVLIVYRSGQQGWVQPISRDIVVRAQALIQVHSI